MFEYTESNGQPTRAIQWARHHMPKELHVKYKLNDVIQWVREKDNREKYGEYLKEGKFLLTMYDCDILKIDYKRTGYRFYGL